MVPKVSVFMLSAVLLLITSSCAFKRVNRSKNVTYLGADSARGKPAEKLNVFAPHKPSSLKDVFIFIHGGNWNSGKKSLYSFLGNRLARKNVVAVIIDYPESPGADYDEMASAAASAVKWVKEHIEQYGGDPNRIFVSGHSAGGHLAALISVREKYFDSIGISSPIRGAILIDAAGLDMYTYLKEEDLPSGNTYLQTFTTNPAAWKLASPLYHVHKGMPPMLIYRGGKTYPSIATSNEKFVDALEKLGDHPAYQVLKGKRHIPMIVQFLNSGNRRYKEIIGFMQKQP